LNAGREVMPAGEGRYVHKDSGEPVRDIVPPGFLYEPGHALLRVFEVQVPGGQDPGLIATVMLEAFSAPEGSLVAPAAKLARAYRARGLRRLDDGERRSCRRSPSCRRTGRLHSGNRPGPRNLCRRLRISATSPAG